MLSTAKKKLDCKDLYEYLVSLPTTALDHLYDHPATCLAVFRGLPELARHYVIRMLFVDRTLPETFIATWTLDTSLHGRAVEKLIGLRVWIDRIVGGTRCFDMNESFRRNLQIGLVGDGSNIKTEVSVTSSSDEKRAGGGGGGKDVVFLDKYATERWESVLYYMTATDTSASAAVSGDIARVLINAGLLSYEPSEQSTSITSTGFQFLLMDTPAQVWYFMVKYLDGLKSQPTELVECLAQLFQISFSVLGHDYPLPTSTSEVQTSFLQHLREVGLVFQRKRTSKRFYPTRLAVSLGSSVPTATTGTVTGQPQQGGYVLVETNYRVYAYTDSALQIALLSLFTDVKSRFPGFAVGVLSRESVQQALACGISAEQIIDFLTSRAHPQMAKTTPVIPPTISDQVKLWEMERDRLRFTGGVLYNQFLSQQDYEMLTGYARDQGVLLWTSQEKRLMVVSRQGHDDVKRYWKKNKPSS